LDWQAIGVGAAVAIVAVIGSGNEFLSWHLGVPGLIVFAVLSAVVGVTTSLIVPTAPPGGDGPASAASIVEPVPLFVIAEQPPTSSQFRGREAELVKLKQVHDKERSRRDAGDREARGPVVIEIHGPAGVGKSALAQELARTLRADYPDGLVSAIFGAGGAARGAADVTRDLLLRLGWEEHEVPRDADDRVATLRSLSRNRRILFLFDAVRDHDQLNQVMPAGVRCGVIITSRPELATSLGLAPPEPLGRLSLADGLAVLQSISGTEWLRDAPTAVEIVELCDRLPLAILAAAERIASGASFRHVAELLRNPALRLRVLDYNTRSIRERINSELSRLLPQQHDLLVALSRLDSESFVPWVVRSLLGPELRRGEADSMVANLTAAQLLEHIGADEMGQPRYRVATLVRLTALSHEDHVRLDLAAARQRLDAAYLEVIDEVLARTDMSYRRVHDVPPASAVARVAAHILPHLDSLVRREYLNLVRVIAVAQLPRYRGLVWRVAALLDDRVPALLDHVSGRDERHAHATILAAFDRATSAAVPDPLAEVDIGLARAQFLGAVERHGEAQRELDQIAQRLGSFPDVTDDATIDPAVLERRLRLARVRATTFIQVGAYQAGNDAIAAAERLIEQLTRRDAVRDGDDQSGMAGAGLDSPYVRMDIELLSLLNAEAERIDVDPAVAEPGPRSQAPEPVVFRRQLEESETLRRQGFYSAAATVLRDMLNRDGDVRGRALLRYRLARLRLDQANALLRVQSGRKGSAVDPIDVKPDPKAAEEAKTFSMASAQSAAAAVVDFAQVGDVVGSIRSQCQLLRALVVADETIVATQLSIEIAAQLDQLGDEFLREPLMARHSRARAEVQIARRSYHEAWRSLTTAAATFRELHDWRNHAHTLRIMERLDKPQRHSALGDPF
jgi:hypothetical protein